MYESRSKDFRDIIRLIRTLFINFLKTEGTNIFKYFSLLLSFFNGRYLLLIFEASNTAWNMREYGFHWPVFFRISAGSTIIWDCDLCLCGRVRVSGSPHSRVFYAVIDFSMECFTAISRNFAAQLSKFFFWLAGHLPTNCKNFRNFLEIS